MKAMTQERYGPAREVFRLEDRPDPEPTSRQVLVRVHAAGLNPADWHLTTGIPHLVRARIGLRRPRTSGMGIDLAGVVESVGAEVTRFTPGDRVFGKVDHLPGTTIPHVGSVAELVAVSEHRIAPAPATLSLTEAAALPVAATTALRGVRDTAQVTADQRVLITGASGGVGHVMVQLAKARGGHVTGVCSTRNVELVRSLGADEVIDYTAEDPTSGDTGYDVILDNVGTHGVRAWRRILRRDGVYVASFGRKEHRFAGPFGFLIRMFAVNLVVPERLTILPDISVDGELDELSALVEDGVLRPVIDRTYPMADAAAALEYVGEGHARGKVVVTVVDG